MTITKDTLIEAARLFCEDNKLTVDQFALRTNINTERMKAYLNGEIELSDDDALKLSFATRLPWDPTLRRCPFCGGEASIVRIDDPETGEPYYAIICPDCGIGLININVNEHSTGFFSKKWDAIKAWNRRL